MKNYVHRLTWGVTFLVATLAAGYDGQQAVSAGEIGFIEQFALARDRSVPLAELIPGTDDYYYYHCLYHQQQQDFGQVEKLISQWRERHGKTNRLTEIQHRQALLNYDQAPDKSLEYLRDFLRLNYNHQRETTDRAAQLPTDLNPQLIDANRLRDAMLRNPRRLGRFTDEALVWLAGDSKLSDAQLRELLKRLSHPSVPNLVQHVHRDLEADRRIQFGQHPVHRAMLRSQLDELLQLRPALLNETEFINIYLTKLQPAVDVDLRFDLVARQTHLRQLWSFINRLAPAHNSLKAHVLYHQLALDVERGDFNRQRLLNYLRIPRQGMTLDPPRRNASSRTRYLADLTKEFSTGLPPVENDRAILRRYLQTVLVDANSYQEYAAFIEESYLKQLFAETKILNGLGDSERWSSLLTPAEYQAIRDRVELEFVPTNPKFFGASDAVELEVDIKNVDKLILKVYRINALNYYQDHGEHISTDINLDGLVANHELTYEYNQSPFRRTRERFQLPQLEKPGIYVVDLIGNGNRSRALIHKGQLRHFVRSTPAGYLFTVVDQQSEPLEDASVWCAGRLYSANDQGNILIPFSTSPQKRNVALLHAGQVTLARFQHGGEKYSFQAGIHVDRESLRQRQMAAVIVRAGLKLNGSPISLKAVESASMTIVATDLDGVSTSSVFNEIELKDEFDYLNQFRVPPRTGSLQFTLTVEVKELTSGKTKTLSDTRTFQINQIDKTHAVDDVHIAKVSNGYLLEVLGRSGEPSPNRPVTLSLQHRYFQSPIRTVLRSDDRGRVRLGELAGIVSVKAQVAGGPELDWALQDEHTTRPRRINVESGKTIRIPYPEFKSSAADFGLALLELRGKNPIADRTAAIQWADGYIEIEGIGAGEYLLRSSNPSFEIKISAIDGALVANHILGDKRTLEQRGNESLQIGRVDVEGKKATIQLSGVSPFTRVHVFATNFLPEFDPFANLSDVRDRNPHAFSHLPHHSIFIQGQQIGDEFRYVLERRYAKKFPGNMLTRPELLLNPWDVRDTSTATEELRPDGEMDREEFGVGADASAMAAKRESQSQSTGYANLDFLADGSFVAVNVKPDAEGKVTVEFEALAGERNLYVVAVDQYQTVQRSASMPRSDRAQFDLRLANGLDPKQHYSLAKQISLVGTGATVRIDGLGSGRFQLYDSLDKVYDLFETLQPNSYLERFRFVKRWHAMDEAEKQAKYAEFACHELNFFVSAKDPEFFQDVVQPYLQNKLHKTFMDHYLLEDDLAAYRAPWQYRRLNSVEKVLLARRIADELATTQSFLRDRLNLKPADVARDDFLFTTGLLGKSLSETLSDEVELRQLNEKSANLSLSSGGGFGGGRQNARKATRMFAAPQSAVPSSEAEGFGMDADDSFDAGIRINGRLAERLYQQLDKTKEWAENNYYRLPIDQQLESLVDVNAFWLDWAMHDESQPFRSQHFAAATGSFTEAMLALSVMDLPSEAPEHETQVVEQTVQIKLAGDSILLHEKIEPVELAENAAQILVSQNFYRFGERHITVNGQQLDRFVTGEFLHKTTYGCQVVVTNPTSSRQNLDVLVQIPVGAIAVGNSKATGSVKMQLQPYRTQTLDYYFYFPSPGDYAYFPVHIAQDSKLVAFAPSRQLKVVGALSEVDTSSWTYVSQEGSDEQVVEYLQNRSLQDINLSRIAFRMSDVNIFRRVTDVLRQRHGYDHTLWSYALRHNEQQAVTEFLQHEAAIVDRSGPRLESSLLDIQPVERARYQHLEYHPLVNARAHSIGAKRQILNDRFLAQYQQWLNIVAHQRQMSNDDRLVTVYYLLLQDRVEEALREFSVVDRSRVVSQMQFDYCRAYLSMSTGATGEARRVAEQYANYPVPRWQNAFALVSQHLDEIEGKTSSPLDPSDRNQSQEDLANKQPTFEFEIESGAIKIRHQHIEQVRIRYYLMDVELLFSRNPFVQQDQRQFAYVEANLDQQLSVDSASGETTHRLPDELRNQNVLVEIEAAGRRQSAPYYSNNLYVQMIENYGQLKVSDSETKKPLSTVYCKVYARTEAGEVVFLKDGYTDLRGRFDYSTVSTNALDNVERLAILVLSEERGAIVKEVAPPAR